MATPDLLKLAPNLSAEERYKIIFGDLLGQTDGEPSKLSESELKAMLRFDSKAMWQEYFMHVAMMRYANMIWINEIETEKLRSYAFYLHLSYQLERVAKDTDAPKATRAKRFAALKETVGDLHRALEGFYAYRQAISKLETILYGVPIFGKAMQASIATQFALIEQAVNNYNSMIRDICECHDAKRFIKPLVENMESYLIPDAVPSEAEVADLVDFIKHLAESEIQSRD